MSVNAEPLPEEMREFARLVDSHRFYEAHEVLENLWVVEVAPLKEFYKGLIMAAVALCHWQRGNPRSALIMRESAMSRLRALPPGFGGVDATPFLRAFETQFSRLEADRALSWSPEIARHIPPIGW